MNCTIRPHHGHHRWNIDSRKDLERLWNANIHPKGGAFLSIRQFALSYGFPPSSLHEELSHGFVSKVLKDSNGRRFIYPEYSAEKAQRRATHEAAQKGRRGKITTNFAKKLVFYLEKGFSVTTCLAELKAQGWKHLPCERTVYCHLQNGLVILPVGKHVRYTPYRKKKKRKAPERAVKCKTHRSIELLPTEAKNRGTFGFWEMDTVVSCAGGRGGLLVMIERMSRRYLVAYIKAISQECVHRQIRRWMKAGSLGKVLGVVTDNGCEFLNQEKLDRLFASQVYYTHAYSSWEKGSVENCNGLLRFFFPKGTDFSRVSHADIIHAEDVINRTIRKTSLKGKSAYEVFQALSCAA